MEASFYTQAAWRQVRAQARKRDNDRCTVSRLLGGKCGGLTHVHHIDVHEDPLDLHNLATVCQVHHPQWEALRRGIVERRARNGWKRCPHQHRYAHARLECERKLNLALAD